ncbi:MAG TPA: SDR family oxidoreductase [Dissulfurispiraceae bacterium]|nr:SDR family oxidoreductase [Dissulfurispiraceae bacterium]
MKRKVAIVSGGAAGLGRQIVAALVEAGFFVCANYHSSRKSADKLIDEIGDNAMAVRADVCSRDEVSEMVKSVLEKWRRLDVVVNNAGIARDALLLRQSEADWDAVLGTNVKGVFNMTQVCAPYMKNGSHIVNISSYAGLKGKKGQAAYSASKAALLGLTKTAAVELASQGIRVNAVLPGYMPTGMGTAASDALRAASKESLLQTLSDPHEVARFISYLVTTNTITGQTFVFDSRII